MSTDVWREIVERLARVEQRVEDVEEEIRDLKRLIESRNSCIDDLERRMSRVEVEVSDLKRIVAQRNGYFKWITVILAMILSFVAALFGLGWKPP